MKIWEIILIALGVSMDAFAVSICKGLSCKDKPLKTGLVCGAWFGFFQFLMPVIGFFVGSLFAGFIESFDHWVAFVLLGVIGANMIKEAFSKEQETVSNELSFLKMLVFAIATSIDALAVGITFALLKVNIWVCAGIIGAFTFTCSFIGAVIGRKFGEKFKNKAELLGGIILIVLGIKILIEHLFF